MPKQLSVEFKLLMSKHVQSVNLLSVLAEVGLRSCTISSLVSVSASEFEYPVLAFSLRGGSEMEGYLDTGSSVWINLLNSGQTNIAQHFSKKRIGESDLISRSGKKVNLTGSIGQFEGEVISKVAVSESIFFFSKVLNVELMNMAFDPLTYYSRRFNGLTIV